MVTKVGGDVQGNWVCKTTRNTSYPKPNLSSIVSSGTRVLYKKRIINSDNRKKEDSKRLTSNEVNVRGAVRDRLI